MKTSKATFQGKVVRCRSAARFGDVTLTLEDGSRETVEVLRLPSDQQFAVLGLPNCPRAEAPSPRPNSLPEDDALRAQYPMADGLIDYFPNALAEVARVSHIGSQKHNKGEPMHWARGKSTDHRNKIARHLVDAGGVDVVMVDGKEERVRHSAYLAWRALANLQEELEREEGYPPSRASRF